MRSRLEASHGAVLSYGQRYIVEASYLNNKLFIASKVGYEINLVLVAIRANAIVYTDFQQIDLRFRPEVGLTLLSRINLMYGVNIPLTSQEMNELAFHQFSLTFNFDSRVNLK
jgi:hypothetical protein